MTSSLEIFSRDERNVYTAANAVTEGMLSESLKFIFFEGATEEVSVGPEFVAIGEEGGIFSSLIEGGMEKAVAEEIVRKGSIRQLTKKKTKIADVEELLDALIDWETNYVKSAGKDEQNLAQEQGQEPEIEYVIRAGYHKDLDYSKKPRINNDPDWY
jgi:hypothetical protein